VVEERIVVSRGPKCAICGKPVEAAYRPFCSARCKQVDLNRWLTESYRVPAGVVDHEEEDQPSSLDKGEEDA
jgi:endogenous inhibitor of DNA gyrase (YacG/DUF329 family)